MLEDPKDVEGLPETLLHLTAKAAASQLKLVYLFRFLEVIFVFLVNLQFNPDAFAKTSHFITVFKISPKFCFIFSWALFSS